MPTESDLFLAWAVVKQHFLFLLACWVSGAFIFISIEETGNADDNLKLYISRSAQAVFSSTVLAVPGLLIAYTTWIITAAIIIFVSLTIVILIYPSDRETRELCVFLISYNLLAMLLVAYTTMPTTAVIMFTVFSTIDILKCDPSDSKQCLHSKVLILVMLLTTWTTTAAIITIVILTMARLNDDHSDSKTRVFWIVLISVIFVALVKSKLSGVPASQASVKMAGAASANGNSNMDPGGTSAVNAHYDVHENRDWDSCSCKFVVNDANKSTEITKKPSLLRFVLDKVPFVLEKVLETAAVVVVTWLLKKIHITT